MSKNLFYIGSFSEEFSEEDGVLYKNAEMFSVGTHRGVTYTEEDLTGLAENFSVADKVPIQLDHSNSVKDTVGFLESASVKGGKLLGKLKFIDEDIQKKVKLGLMEKLSISFYLKETEDGVKPEKLREVSLVAFPQVKSARLFSENGYISDYEEKGGSPNMTDNKQTVDLSELKAQLKAELETEIHEQYSELQKQVETLQGTDVKFKEATVTSKIEKFSADNKIVPAQNDALRKLLTSFSEEQAQAFEEFMSNTQVVNFDEQGEFEGENGDEDKKDTRTKEEKDFDSFYETHTQKYGKSL